VPRPLDPVADLQSRLARVPLQKLRGCVRTWWGDHGFAEHPAAVGKRVALALIEQPKQPAKLAGIFVLHEQLGTQLRASDLAAFAQLFAKGHLADWTVVDSFIMKVLVTLLERGPGRREVVRALVSWRGVENIWQRRAACLAFVKLASQGDAALAGLVDQVLVICRTVVWSHERHDQNAVGCVLRELACADPARVEAFVRRHAPLMSKECARHACSKFPAALRGELLAHHKRATTLRRG
jgi:3-methyladenine DNA glycosylase AlkD